MCRSCVNVSNYGIKLDANGRNMLTNELSQRTVDFDNTYFTITELEVWEVEEAELLPK